MWLDHHLMAQNSADSSKLKKFRENDTFTGVKWSLHTLSGKQLMGTNDDDGIL